MGERTGYYFDVNAWRNSRRVSKMSWQARAIYREVMDEIWLHGSIPSKVEEVAELAKIPLEIVILHWPRVHECLVPSKDDPDTLTSERMDEERRKRNRFSKLQRSSGRRGGLAKARNAARLGLGSASGFLAIQDKTRQDKTRQENASKLGEFSHVILSEEQIDKLKAKLGSHFDALVRELDRYGETHPAKFAKYKSHYAVLLQWYDRKVAEGKIAPDDPPEPQTPRAFKAVC